MESIKDLALRYIGDIDEVKENGKVKVSLNKKKVYTKDSFTSIGESSSGVQNFKKYIKINKKESTRCNSSINGKTRLDLLNLFVKNSGKSGNK